MLLGHWPDVARRPGTRAAACGAGAGGQWPALFTTDRRNPLPGKGPWSGRYWARTSDLCRVKAALFR